MENCHSGILYQQPDHLIEECCIPANDAAAFSPAVTWTHFPGRGRGLAACKDVEAGTVLDAAPAVPVQENEGSAHIRQYVFQCRRDGCGEAYAGRVKEALVFGPMALCNHSEQPNARVSFEETAESGLQARLIANRRIAKGDEVTIRYTDSDWYKDNNKF